MVEVVSQTGNGVPQLLDSHNVTMSLIQVGHDADDFLGDDCGCSRLLSLLCGLPNEEQTQGHRSLWGLACEGHEADGLLVEAKGAVGLDRFIDIRQLRYYTEQTS